VLVPKEEEKIQRGDSWAGKRIQSEEEAVSIERSGVTPAIQ